ncbi:ATP-grasp domain-containing protein [Lacrimispora sp.]|uniref:ATP-grasp domain-containing protein n=1 Tax=Lacrimispora sp. TaxID=2719234 RepID=UPI002866A693|nr:ATP-grasp domain-containing protein [Lacrimispora sp.]MDR7814866.1 ATP-grasp domain-containing protein [Lacrimispora sp.]
MNTALVTAIGSFSADIVIKNLKKGGYRVVGCDIYPAEWIADSGNVASFYQVPLATDEKRYVNTILKICREEQAKVLIVLTDVEVDVWNRYRYELALASVTLCLSSEKPLLLCRDKRELYRFLKEKGIGNPIPTLELMEADAERLSYPAVIKPFNGRSSQGLRYIQSLDEMKGFLECGDSEGLIVQPYYQGSIITVDVVRQAETGESVAVCRKELLRTPNGAGTSVLVFLDPVLEATCRDIANALGINGCVNFEFIQTEDGTYHMLECNPRFSGGVEFSCLAGYDCVTNHLRCFIGEAIEPLKGIMGMYIARKYEEYIMGN